MYSGVAEFGPRSLWHDAGDADHVVQFYEADAGLLTSLSEFVARGLHLGEAVVVVATPAHRRALAEQATERGPNLPAAAASGRFIALDAAELLAHFMVDGGPDAERFDAAVGDILDRAERGGRRVRVFGEMVALLAAAGDGVVAVQLEGLWNRLQHARSFTLFCAYGLHGIAGAEQPLDDICELHSRVIPAESYTALQTDVEQARAIVSLQQKAASLEAEVAERQAAEQRFRFLAESVPQKMFTALPTGEVDYCNAQWTDFTGVDASAMRNWGWTDVIHRDDVAETLERWQHSISSGESFQCEHRFRRVDGAYRWHLTRAQALLTPHGRVLMWVGSHTDIEDQKRREAVLARSIRQRDEFLSAISHDLKTPLTVLRGQAQLLRRRIQSGVPETAAILRGLEQIERRARTMADLVDELLDVTRIRAGEELSLVPHPVDLVELVRDVVARYAGAGSQLAVRTSQAEISGWWDRAHLRRAVDALVRNAMKYSALAGDVSLGLSMDRVGDDAMAVFTVEDHGIGIPVDELPHVFERYHHGTDARAVTGLGLAGVRQIVEQHGGTVAVASQEGVGTTFTVRLPLNYRPVRTSSPA